MAFVHHTSRWEGSKIMTGKDALLKRKWRVPHILIKLQKKNSEHQHLRLSEKKLKNSNIDLFSLKNENYINIKRINISNILSLFCYLNKILLTQPKGESNTYALMKYQVI